MTVHPNCSETRYGISDIEALCEVESILTSISVRSETEKSTQFCVFLSGSMRKWHTIMHKPLTSKATPFSNEMSPLCTEIQN